MLFYLDVHLIDIVRRALIYPYIQEHALKASEARSIGL